MVFTTKKNTTFFCVRYKNNRNMYLNVFDLFIYIYGHYTYKYYIYYIIFHSFNTLYLQNWLNLFNFFGVGIYVFLAPG